MGTSVSSFCLLVLSLCCLLHCSAAGHGKKKLPSAMVVGTVFCNTCFNQEFSKSSHSISGASVSVQCGSFRQEVKTNSKGVFRARLPPQVGKHIEAIKACSVTLIKSSEPFCAVASSATSSEIRLKSRKNGVHVFSAGFFTFKPLKEPELCSQKPKVTEQKITQPTFFFFPPVPFIPPPSILPPNPLLPPPSILPPNPLQPPPSLLPPLPFQPSPPPSLLPPLPFQPSPPPSFLPPLPFQPSPPTSFLPPLIPFIAPPPPPPPTFHLPPFPFLPPLIPGIPPASPMKGASP